MKTTAVILIIAGCWIFAATASTINDALINNGTEAEEWFLTKLFHRIVKRDTEGGNLIDALNRNVTEAEILIETPGTDLTVKDGNEQVAMHYAAKFSQLKVIKLLIEKGQKDQINAVDKWGDTSLHEAASRGWADAMELLLQNGGEIDKKNIYGKTSLHWAAEKNNEDVARVLIRYGADLNLKNNDGQTPLYFASNFGHANFVKLLLGSGADVSIKSNSDQSARDIAASQGHQIIVQLIDDTTKIFKKMKLKEFIASVCDRYIAEKPTDYIIGGRPAKPEEFPWMTALGYYNVRKNAVDYRCGGTIISEQFVLTAAHCTDSVEPPIVVRVGTLQLTDARDAKNYYIKDIIRHENYSNKTKRNDIALLQLLKPIQITPDIRIACLNTDKEDLATSISLQVTGWGITETDSDALSNVLLSAELRTVPFQQCNATFVNYNQNKHFDTFENGISETQYCAFDPISNRGSCRGDSGGPLQVFRDSKTAHIVGIVSFGLGCGTTYPGIYTRVSHYIEWIAGYVWPEAV